MRLPPVLLALLLIATAACTSREDGATPAEITTTTTTTVPPGPPVDVELEGPITGGERDLPYNAMPEGYEARYGYTEEEWFVSGEATAYETAGALTPGRAVDGHARRHRAVHDPDARPAPRRSGGLQRHRDRRVEQRHRGS